MRMKFSYNLAASHVHLLKDLKRADKRLELDEYKTGTGVGDLKKQISAIKQKYGQLKYPFLYFYLDKEEYPSMKLRRVFVVNNKEDLKLSEKQLSIKLYGRKEYIKRKLKVLLKKYVPFYNAIQARKLAKSFNE